MASQDVGYKPQKGDKEKMAAATHCFHCHTEFRALEHTVPPGTPLYALDHCHYTGMLLGKSCFSCNLNVSVKMSMLIFFVLPIFPCVLQRKRQYLRIPIFAHNLWKYVRICLSIYLPTYFMHQQCSCFLLGHKFHHVVTIA